MRWLVLILLLFGCKKKKRSLSPGSGAGEVFESAETPVEAVQVGPGIWSESGGFALIVPTGWAGEEGLPKTDLLLILRHEATGTWIALREAPLGDLSPRPRSSCSWEFVDDGSYRTVGALGLSSSATCVPESIDDVLIQAYAANVGDRAVHVELAFPPNRLAEGRRAAESLLEGLKAP